MERELAAGIIFPLYPYDTCCQINRDTFNCLDAGHLSLWLSEALNNYGAKKFSEEFKFCVQEIINVCESVKSEKLRNILFANRTTNAFPSVFAALMIAFHEIIIKENKKVSDYPGIKKAITDLSKRIDPGKKGTIVTEREKNIKTVKGLISDYFIEADIKSKIYENHSTVDIESLIRRSEIELSNYELKQGLLPLSDPRTLDEKFIEKIASTICAIANNGPNRSGKLLIGVTDKNADAERVKALDQIEPKNVGKRFVVGVAREAKLLGVSVEQLVTKLRDGLKKSEISENLKTSVLSNIDYNTFYGYGVIVISIQSQKELSYLGDDIYWRSGDSTSKASTAKEIALIAQRFV